jgi:hypothetical protein
MANDLVTGLATWAANQTPTTELVWAEVTSVSGGAPLTSVAFDGRGIGDSWALNGATYVVGDIVLFALLNTPVALGKR